MRGFWEEELSEEQEQSLVDRLAKEIKTRKLEAPAILLLEMHKPLAGLIGHGMVATAPFFAPFVGFDNVNDYSRLLGNRRSMEHLIQALEKPAGND